jgi:hypothetical protein
MASEGVKALNWRGLWLHLLFSAGLIAIVLAVANLLEIRPYGTLIAVGALTVFNGVRVLRNRPKPHPPRTKRST